MLLAMILIMHTGLHKHTKNMLSVSLPVQQKNSFNCKFLKLQLFFALYHQRLGLRQ